VIEAFLKRKKASKRAFMSQMALFLSVKVDVSYKRVLTI
jgi:hypothetical protein